MIDDDGNSLLATSSSMVAATIVTVIGVSSIEWHVFVRGTTRNSRSESKKHLEQLLTVVL
jgi:hypothetical protein